MALALDWALSPPGVSPWWAGTRMAMVRGFATYLAALDPRTEVPPADLLPTPSSTRLVPYLYTDEEICALMVAARTLDGLKSTTYATLIGLLAATGMRVGEAIALDRDDVDEREGTLVVRQGKFGKARALVLHRTTTKALRAYAGERVTQCSSAPTPIASLARSKPR